MRFWFAIVYSLLLFVCTVRSSMISLRDKVKLPALDPSKHKGQAGRIGVVGGSFEYTGAPYLAAMSALRCGSDLSHVFCLDSAATAIKSYAPDLIVHPYLSSNSSEAQESAERVKKWFPALDVLVVGPGLGRDESVLTTAKMLIKMAQESGLKTVVDGDGLWALKTDEKLLRSLGKNTVLTPNKPEWSRIEQVIKDEPLKGPLIVRKGAKDLVGSLECSTKGSERRCGGQGDLLAGAIAAFLNYDEDMELMAWAACDLMRTASSMAFAKKKRSMISTDVLEEIPNALEQLYPVQIE